MKPWQYPSRARKRAGQKQWLVNSDWWLVGSQNPSRACIRARNDTNESRVRAPTVREGALNQSCDRKREASPSRDLAATLSAGRKGAVVYLFPVPCSLFPQRGGGKDPALYFPLTLA